MLSIDDIIVKAENMDESIETIVEMENILEELRDKPFSSLSYNEKLNIVKNGPPRPMLNITKVKEGKGTYSFQKAWYTKSPWICGCARTNKMYCWPCVLFSPNKNVWGNLDLGTSDIMNISLIKKRHCATKDHTYAQGQLVRFGNQKIETQQIEADIEKHNAIVKINRYILARIIDSVCFMGRLGHNEAENSANRGNFIESLHLVARTNDILANHLKTATIFSGTSPEIQNDMIAAVSLTMTNEIKLELQSCNYVSIIIDETTDIAHTSQLSTTLRYTARNEVQERFIRFEDVSLSRTAHAIFEIIEKTLAEFQCDTKLICQTYDGAAVMAGEHTRLQRLIKDNYPNAKFVHCYAHEINHVLQQSVNDIKPCKIFYQTCMGLAAFFSRTSSRSAELDEVLKIKLPTVTPTKWVHSARLVTEIVYAQQDLHNLLLEMSQDRDRWDAETSAAAKGFSEMLEEPEYQFLLNLFFKIMPRAELLFETLQNKMYEVSFCNTKIKQFIEQIENLRDEIPDLCTEDEPPTKRQCSDQLVNDDQRYRALGYEILNTISARMKERFFKFQDFKFLELLDAQKFESYQSIFPDNLLETLILKYPGQFETIDLRNQLDIVYKDPDCQMLKLQDLFRYLKTSGLYEVWPEVTKLAEFFLCIPAASSGVEHSDSALKRIQTFQHSSQTQVRKSYLGMLYIEKDFLKKMSEKEDFYNKVIDMFKEQKRRPIFLDYK